MILKKIAVHSPEEVTALFEVVQEIWQEVFTPIIGEKQVAYMLKNYQSIEMIQSEIDNGAHYFLLYLDELPVGYTAYEETEEQIYISKLYLSSTYVVKVFQVIFLIGTRKLEKVKLFI